MKKIIFCLALLAMCLGVEAKKVKVTTSPSTAKIYVDGSYYGDGTVMVNIPAREGFVALKIEEPGYATIETRIYSSDKRKAISLVMREDPMWVNTEVSANANKYFSVRVSKDYYKVGDDGKIDAEFAWKMIHQVILNYFDEIQTSDMLSGYVQTAWQVKSFPEVKKVIRTRVSVKQTDIGSDLAFQIRIQSQEASLSASKNSDAYKDTNRILKDIAPIINEFQSRLGKQ